MTVRVSRHQVLAWRLSAHALGDGLPAERRHDAVRPAGLRTGGPDSALVGWHARAEGVGSGDVREALLARRWVEAPTAPGVALVDGAVSCAWRARKRGRRPAVTLLPLDGWRPAHLRRITEGLAEVAALRGAEPGAVEVSAAPRS